MDMEMPSEQETGVRVYRSQELAGACVCSLQKLWRLTIFTSDSRDPKISRLLSWALIPCVRARVRVHTYITYKHTHTHTHTHTNTHGHHTDNRDACRDMVA